MNIEFSFKCHACKENVPLDLKNTKINDLLALKGQIEDELKTRKKASLPASEAQAAKFDADQQVLLELFAWWKPEYGPLGSDQIPANLYSEHFKGKKPSSQFGVWMYHKSRERFSAPGIYVRHTQWHGDSRLYELRWLQTKPIKSNQADFHG